MKLNLCFLMLLGCALNCKAQCTVSLGADIHVCSNLQSGFPPTAIADGLTITNSTSPYTYEWSIEPISYFNTTLYASDFLDDTTLANPTALEMWEDSLTFFLKVEDASELVCYDTIIVSASLFGTHLGNLTFYINAGDSVLLFGGSNVVSNYPTDSLVWRPSIGLSDSTAATPMASPPTDQSYRSVIWDTQGCMQEGSPCQFVVVSPVGIDEEPQTPSVQVYSDQQELVLNVEETTLPCTFQLWDALGRKMMEKRIVQSSERIPTIGLGTGVFIYSIQTEKERLISGQVHVN